MPMVSRDVALLKLVVERPDVDAPRIVLSSDGVGGWHWMSIYIARARTRLFVWPNRGSGGERETGGSTRRDKGSTKEGREGRRGDEGKRTRAKRTPIHEAFNVQSVFNSSILRVDRKQAGGLNGHRSMKLFTFNPFSILP